MRTDIMQMDFLCVEHGKRRHEEECILQTDDENIKNILIELCPFLLIFQNHFHPNKNIPTFSIGDSC